MTTTCPFCQHQAHRRDFGFWAKPEPETDYADVLRCPKCKRWYAPKETETPAP